MVSAAASVFLVLAVAAVVFAVQANRQTRLAQSNARQSRGREVAAYATQSLDDDPEKSILLAMQAVNATLRFGQRPVPAAEEALHQAILSSQVRVTLRGHSYSVYGVAFSPDGKRLATASGDQTAKVWDAESGKELLTLRGHSGRVFGVVFSPDGKRLATTSADTAKVWDAESGKELLTLRGHSGNVLGVVFSPDDKRLATASWDKTAKVWDAESGKELLTLRGHSDPVNGVAFSPDGTRIATGSGDGTVQVYALDPRELLNLARSRVTRSFTAEECQRYFQSETCPPLPWLPHSASSSNCSFLRVRVGMGAESVGSERRTLAPFTRWSNRLLKWR
jgi:WD40 repeat protein